MSTNAVAVSQDTNPTSAPSATTPKTIEVRVRRQSDADQKPYWETFRVPHKPNMNVISVLMAIQLSPFNAEGKQVAPVAWECSCLEEVCGACSMNINGKPRQACSALVDQIDLPLVLEPFKKLSLIHI